MKKLILFLFLVPSLVFAQHIDLTKQAQGGGSVDTFLQGGVSTPTWGTLLNCVAITYSTSTHAFACVSAADASHNGYLTSADWSTFNGKQPAGSYALQSTTLTATSPLTGGGDLSTNRSFGCQTASSSQAGCLSSTDWSTFNGKQATISTSSAVTHQYVTGFTSPNTFTRAQPVCSDLSDSAGGCSMSTTAGGDLSGTLPSPTVTDLSHVTNGSLANSGLVNSTMTLNGATATLGASSQVPVYGPCSEGVAQFSSSDTLTNSTTGEQTFSTKCTLAANYLTTNRVLRVSVTVDNTTAATTPTYIFKAKLCTVSGCGSGTIKPIYANAANTPNTLAASSFGLTLLIQGTAAAGSSTTVYSSIVGGSGAPFPNLAAARNNQATAVTAVPTNGTLYLQFSITFGGTGSNNPFTLTQLVVEGLN